MIDEVRLTYAALSQAPLPDSRDLRVRRLSGVGAPIWLGLDATDREHLLVDSPSAPRRQSGIASIATEHRELRISGELRRYLDVTCLEEDLVEVFDHLVAAVAEISSDSDPDLGPVVATVLDRWRSFFARTSVPPGLDAIAGIVGELLLLRDLASFDATDALSAWVGPSGARHDFRRRDAAIEVKTTLAHTSWAVSIHGEDQLLEPANGTLHLQFVRLETGDGLTLCITDLIDELALLGVPRLELLETLAKAGLPPVALGDAGSVRFDVRERITVPVDDEMPRIVPTTFVEGRRPSGVIDVIYRIDLDRVASRGLDRMAYRDLIARLGVGDRT